MKIALPVLAALLALAGGTTASRAEDNDWSVIQRGLYLTRAGDCAACHTVEGGKPFAGGYPLKTPFGTVYSANLTPDGDTGLGTWDEGDFYRAMNAGRSKDGSRLYPAFPYTHFTYVTREDSDAIFSYLQTLQPVRNRVSKPDLVWPLSWRFLMIGWNWLNFDEKSFVPDAGKSPAYNRGKYLVEGLMHCGMCHSPKNVIGAEEDDPGDRFAGGMAEGWLAPPLVGGSREGIGDWSEDDLVQYLKYGRNGRSIAFGPMAQVVSLSTQHMTDDDLQAVATYLKDIAIQQQDRGTKETKQAAQMSDDVKHVGALVYATQCSACHRADGKGVPNMLPPLADSSFVQADHPRSVIRLILEGGKGVATSKFPTPHKMPAFDWKLTDDEVAAVATYVRNSFGNGAPAVSADDVEEVRKAQ
ncbi:cytochrome c [Propylenella binzhouense]|nr:c-type cytochrome [Propylenella binzhouense]